MLDILKSFSQFELENNIILPPVTIDPPVTKQAKKQDKQQSFLINNHSGRSTEFKILDFLPSFLIINTDQRVIELFILNKKVCNIFNISEQTVNYEQWKIENNGINQSIIYDDKKIVNMLNKSVDSFYRFIGSNPDIFPDGINKITPYRLRVNHKLGGHFIAVKENKTKNQLVLTSTKQDQQKLLTFLNTVIKNELLETQKDLIADKNKKTNELKKQYAIYKQNVAQPSNTLLISSLKSELITVNVKLTKLSDKIAKIDNFNFTSFTNSLKSKINFKDKIIFRLMSEVNKLSYLNTDSNVKKTNLRDIKKNIKRIFLLSLSGNNHLRPVRLVTNNLNLDIDEMILVCLTNTNNNGLPIILDSQLDNDSYIIENNQYLKPYNCYFEGL